MSEPSEIGGTITLFLCGDVMTGRGIDQVLPHPNDPVLYEPYVRSAKEYVELAEEASGDIPKPVDFSYIWGDALAELKRVSPDLKLINLETSVTESDDYWEGKGIHYRMHPKNVRTLNAAEIDICSLANNHVLDWGYSGLRETLDTLEEAGIRSAGAGLNEEEAEAPSVMEVDGKGRVIVFSLGSVTSGIPSEWAASKAEPGVNLLNDYSHESLDSLSKQVAKVKRKGDVVVFSIHWGSNWGYEIPDTQRKFARRLIDNAGIDVIHGHSSHHAKGIEVYKKKPIIYGSGDFINDYEGISGYEEFRDDLVLMYFLTIDTSTTDLLSFNMTPLQIKHFRLNNASKEDAFWMKDTLDRECGRLGTGVKLIENNKLVLEWG